MKKFMLIQILIILGFVFSVQAQRKTLSRSAYHAPMRQADALKEDASRREKITLEIYSKGKIKAVETEIDEILTSDRQRYFFSRKEGDKITKLELIQIGKNFYRKEDDGKWTKESSWGKPDSFLSIPLPKTQEYSVEDVKVGNLPLKLYRYYAVYDETSAAEGDEKETFWEQNVWIDSKGLKVREEMTVGKPISKEIWSHRRYDIEFNPKNLKIAAPIK